MILFQAEIEEHTKLADHYRELAAKREALAVQLLAIQQQADSDLSSLKLLLGKCKEVAPSAIASLRSAVLEIFTGDGNNGGDGEQPTDQKPGPDDLELELLCLNGETGDCLTTDDLTDVAIEADTSTPLTCDIDTAPLLGQVCEWACPLASPFACPIEFPEPELEKEPKEPAYTEFVEVSDRVGYIKVQSTGEIQCVYAGFSRKDRAEAWGRFLAVTHDIASGFEVRPAKHLGYKWEVKFWDMSLSQIQKLAAEDLSKSPRVEVGNSKPPAKQAVVLKSDRIVVGQKILTKSGQTLQITSTLSSDDRFFAKDASDQRKLVRINDVLEFIDTEDTLAQAAGIEPPGGWGKPQPLAQAELPIYQRSDGGFEVEPSIRESASVLESGDIVEIVETRHPAHMGLIGTVESINVFSELPITVRTPRGAKGYMRSDLKFISKGETPQSQGLKSGQLLMGNKVVTNGNYVGLGRRSAILNNQNGTADKLAALELVRGGLSPEAAMTAVKGAIDTDYDF